MKILCALKTELDLNNAEKNACARHAGAARFAFNWGLVRKQQAYLDGQKTPTAIDLHRELNGSKSETTFGSRKLNWLGYMKSRNALRKKLCAI